MVSTTALKLINYYKCLGSFRKNQSEQSLQKLKSVSSSQPSLPDSYPPWPPRLRYYGPGPCGSSLEVQNDQSKFQV